MSGPTSPSGSGPVLPRGQPSVVLQPGAEPVPGYQLVRLLGSGGCGEVWMAEGPGRFRVALKFVRIGHAADITEMRALELIKEIRHPNLMSTFGAWPIPGFHAIAMELADESLWDRYCTCVAEGTSGIPRDELVEYFREAAKGIDYLNNHGSSQTGKQGLSVQHRDIKPQNIMLVGGGVKVADFGLARTLERAVTSHTGSMTPAYAAPEFFQGKTSRHSDQYSLGVTYCELRGGRLPFPGSMAEIMAGHLSGEPDLTMLPDCERPAVRRALAKVPEERWPTCRTFVDALERGIREGGSAETSASGVFPAMTMVPPGMPAGAHSGSSQRSRPTEQPHAGMDTATGKSAPRKWQSASGTSGSGGSRKSAGRLVGAIAALLIVSTGSLLALGAAGYVSLPFWPSAQRQVEGDDQGADEEGTHEQQGSGESSTTDSRTDGEGESKRESETHGEGSVAETKSHSTEAPHRVPLLFTSRHAAPVLSLAISRDGETALSGARDGTLRKWTTIDGQQQKVMEGHTTPVACVAISHDGETGLSGGGDMDETFSPVDCTVRFWHLESGTVLHECQGHTAPVTGVWFLDADKALSASHDGTFRIWSAQDGSELKKLEGQHSPILTAAVSDDGRFAASAAEDLDADFEHPGFAIWLWDLTTGRPLRPFFHGHRQPITDLRFSPDGTALFSRSLDETIRIWNVDWNAAARSQPARHPGPSAQYPHATFDRQGQRVLLCGRQPVPLLDEMDPGRDHVRLWDVVRGKIVAEQKGHPSAVVTSVFSDDGTFTLSGSEDGTLRLWPLPTRSDP